MRFTLLSSLMLAACVFVVACERDDTPRPPQPGVLAEMYGEQLSVDDLREQWRQMRERQAREAVAPDTDLRAPAEPDFTNRMLQARQVDNWSRGLAGERLQGQVDVTSGEVESYIDRLLEREEFAPFTEERAALSITFNRGLAMVREQGLQDPEAIREVFESLRPDPEVPPGLEEEEELLYLEEWHAQWTSMVEGVLHWGASPDMRLAETEEEYRDQFREQARLHLARHKLADQVIEREGYLDDDTLLQEARQLLGRARIAGRQIDMETREALHHMLREREWERMILREQEEHLTVYDPDVESEMEDILQQRGYRTDRLVPYQNAPFSPMR